MQEVHEVPVENVERSLLSKCSVLNCINYSKTYGTCSNGKYTNKTLIVQRMNNNMSIQ